MYCSYIIRLRPGDEALTSSTDHFRSHCLDGFLAVLSKGNIRYSGLVTVSISPENEL